MAAFDPVAAGGVAFDPTAAGGIAVDPQGSGQPATSQGGNIPGGGFAAGNPPGFDASVAAQVAQQREMAERSKTYANDMYPLFKAQQELALAPTGKGSDALYDLSAKIMTQHPEWLQRAEHFVTTLGGSFGGVMTPEETTHYAEANKFLTQASLGGARAMQRKEGGQTASAASPSVLIPKPAAQAVLQGMIGLRRMEHDQTLQWQNSGQQVGNINRFVTQFQTNADPRVYVWDQLTGPQRKKVLDSMDATQRSAFMNRVGKADNDGIYNNFGMMPPQLAPAQ